MEGAKEAFEKMREQELQPQTPEEKEADYNELLYQMWLD